MQWAAATAIFFTLRFAVTSSYHHGIPLTIPANADRTVAEAEAATLLCHLHPATFVSRAAITRRAWANSHGSRFVMTDSEASA